MKLKVFPHQYKSTILARTVSLSYDKEKDTVTVYVECKDGTKLPECTVHLDKLHEAQESDK